MKKTQKEYEVIDFPPLTDEERAVLERLDAMPDDEIDYTDNPPTSPDAKGDFYYKQPVNPLDVGFATFQIDSDVLAGLRRIGDGWQSKVNEYLRQGLATHAI
jgi:uncharacterized protein (DUF4415 family)